MFLIGRGTAFRFHFSDAGPRFWFPRTTMLGVSFFEVGALLIFESRLKHDLFEHGFPTLRGFCAGASDFAGRGHVFINGCRSRFSDFRDTASRFVSEVSYPEFWHVVVPICELLILRLLFLGMLGLYVFWFVEAPLLFLICGCGVPIFDFSGTTVWVFVSSRLMPCGFSKTVWTHYFSNMGLEH